MKAPRGWYGRGVSRFLSRAAALSVAASLALAMLPAAASAVRVVKPVTEPGLNLGLSGALGELTGGTTAQNAAWSQRAHRVNAEIVRLDVTWSQIAPATRPAGFNAADQNSPGYNWATLDEQVRTLSQDGFIIFLSAETAPTWAEGPDVPPSVPAGSWEPNAGDLGQFATAIATRYDGRTPDPLNPGVHLPKISFWQAWNEPNLTAYLTPQWLQSGSTEIPEAPVVYRGMENAFYSSVKAVSASNFVVGAATAPYGDPPGGARMSPVTFDQNLFCLNASNQSTGACSGPVYMNAIDDHPYVSGLCCAAPTMHALGAADTSVPDMYKIVDVLKAARAAGTVAPAGTSVWSSELGWDTSPPNPNSGQGSPPGQVAQWATQALYILWSQGVSTVLWYQLGDDPESPEGWSQTYTEGLYFTNGTAKPAAQAFAFPFLTNRRTKGSVEAWGRSPQTGTVTIQERASAARSWRSVLAFKAKTGQVFEVPIALTGSAQFRAFVAGTDSPSWSQAA